jgi:hypothetical protein
MGKGMGGWNEGRGRGILHNNNLGALHPSIQDALLAPPSSSLLEVPMPTPNTLLDSFVLKNPIY